MIKSVRESWMDAVPHTRTHEGDTKELLKLMGALETGKSLRTTNRRNTSTR